MKLSGLLFLSVALVLATLRFASSNDTSEKTQDNPFMDLPDAVDVQIVAREAGWAADDSVCNISSIPTKPSRSGRPMAKWSLLNDEYDEIVEKHPKAKALNTARHMGTLGTDTSEIRRMLIGRELFPETA